MKRQLAFLIARAQVSIEWIQPEDEGEPEEDLSECLSNTHLPKHYKAFGKELGVEDPKSLGDIYKSHLENLRSCSLAYASDSLANVSFRGWWCEHRFCSSKLGWFAHNTGFGNDKLIVDTAEGDSWIYRNKDHGVCFVSFSRVRN